MSEILDAAIPVFGLIWLGYFFYRIDMPGREFWPLAEKMTYHVFLPALFFVAIQRADFDALENIGGLILAVVLCSLGTSLAAFIVHYVWLKLDGKRFASFYQGSIRFNNYIGIPLIVSLFGEEGLLIYAVIIGVSIPLSNILVVLVMTHYASEEAVSARRMARAVYRNPLIIWSLLGVTANVLHVPLFYAGDMLQFFAAAATALGLLTVGAGIDFEAITSSKRNLAVVSVLKLVINPLLMLGVCLLCGVGGVVMQVAIIYAALPVAASSYIMSRQFGAHAPLMASIIILTTLLAMGSLPALLLILGVG